MVQRSLECLKNFHSDTLHKPLEQEALRITVTNESQIESCNPQSKHHPLYSPIVHKQNNDHHNITKDSSLHFEENSDIINKNCQESIQKNYFENNEGMTSIFEQK